MNVFLEIKNIKKHFGEGESRVEVLKGIDIEIEKGEFESSACFSDRQAQVNQHF